MPAICVDERCLVYVVFTITMKAIAAKELWHRIFVMFRTTHQVMENRPKNKEIFLEVAVYNENGLGIKIDEPIKLGAVLGGMFCLHRFKSISFASLSASNLS